MRSVLLLAPVVLLAGCVSALNPVPVLENGDRVAPPATDAAVAEAHARQAAVRAERDSILAVAAASCTGALCRALVGSRVRLGMTEAQVLAATRTTADAWSIVRTGGTTVMAPAPGSAPADAAGAVALVRLSAGAVDVYGYDGPQGLRTVSSPEDETLSGRATALARFLVREADAQIAAGDFQAGLDLYDRARVLAPDNPLITYRLAVTLDRAHRPLRARMAYARFLHAMELERIDAVGRANAAMADAMVHARERILVLERN